MKLTKVMKVAKSATSRDQIVSAVIAKAEKLSQKRGISVAAAEAEIWKAGGDEMMAAYQQAPVGAPPKPQPKTIHATRAEAILHERALKRMRKAGVSYAKACEQELTKDPELYKAYESELAAGATYEVPDPGYLDVQPDQGKFQTKSKSVSNHEGLDTDDDDDDDFNEQYTGQKRKQLLGDAVGQKRR